MRSTHSFESINHSKANFDQIYTARDPRDYFRVLGGLDYVIPTLAAPIFRQLASSRRDKQDGPLTVLDLGCSYGINAALLRFPCSLELLRERYCAPEVQALSSADVEDYDRLFFASWPPRDDSRIIGLDTSGEAAGYAERVGVLDRAITADFEREAPDGDVAAALRSVDLIISTGCVGYVTERTFEQLYVCHQNGQKPWVASFVLRMFPYDGIADVLQRQGLVTEKFEGAAFVQRRFQGADEFERTLSAVEARGLDPQGMEAEGLLLAELYVSRPAEDVEAMPLHRLVSVVSGANRRYGRRYQRLNGGGAYRHVLR